MEIPTFWRQLSMVFFFCQPCLIALQSFITRLFTLFVASQKLIFRAKSKTGVPMIFPLTNASRRLKIGHPILIMWFTASQLPHYIWKSQFLGTHHGTHIVWIPACSFSACCMSLRFASSTLAFASHPRKLGLSQNTVGYGSSIDTFNGKFNVYFMGPSLMAVILAQVSRFGFQW